MHEAIGTTIGFLLGAALAFMVLAGLAPVTQIWTKRTGLLPTDLGVVCRQDAQWGKHRPSNPTRSRTL
jgi:hypothetical protein